eukprot:SAG31_NODE_1336_length_8738_cov_4.855655_5_plen_156_part_00
MCVLSTHLPEPPMDRRPADRPSRTAPGLATRAREGAGGWKGGALALPLWANQVGPENTARAPLQVHVLKCTAVAATLQQAACYSYGLYSYTGTAAAAVYVDILISGYLLVRVDPAKFSYSRLRYPAGTCRAAGAGKFRILNTCRYRANLSGRYKI